jgi:NADP-dependent 3-hydroxy acid dehydrogenase YdfG
MSKVVVVTGASGGIGAALARRLAQDGHAVVLAARRERELKAVASSCGERAYPVVTDVTQRTLVNNLRDAAIRRFGDIDVWVNNAGQGIGRKVLELTDEDLDAMISVNVKAALYGMQAIVPHFQERGGQGHLINVSSFLGRVPLVTFRSAYNAAKAALNALTANARVDLAREHPGIAVTLVIPGLVSTGFQRNAIGGTPPLPASTPSQTPDEVAAVIVSAIERPVAEVYTNPHQAAVALDYFKDVGAFERNAAARRG